MNIDKRIKNLYEQIQDKKPDNTLIVIYDQTTGEQVTNYTLKDIQQAKHVIEITTESKGSKLDKE